MFYAFSIRPLVRLFLAAVMVWMAYVCLYAARLVPVFAATLLVITGALSFLGALVVLRGLSRLFRGYGRTWIG